LKLGTADAGIVWDATLKEYPELEPVGDKLLAEGVEDVTIAVVSGTARPAAALRFARYLAARDRGLEEFKRSGWEAADGDEWAERPELVVYSGALNRPAIEKTIAEFEEREGARVSIKYSGCGILVADMKAIAKGDIPAAFPDAYFACDSSFVPPVQEAFLEPVEVSETDVVLLVARGNPKNLRSQADLARPGMRVAMANEEHSALGALTKGLLENEGIYDAVKKNVTYQAPTADQLVLRMLAGGAGSAGALSEDVAVVYEANCSKARESMDVVRMDAAGHPGAKAVQPFVIARSSKHRCLTERLRAAILSGISRQRFESAGFRWRAGSE
jgi:ABC-type molybdate transport system substrate-binding protein